VKRDHSKQGKARGNTALSGKKPRLLALALLFAVLAGAGFAIGEEKNVSEQTKQQDADPEVIQLDGPIQPSAIITNEGIVNAINTGKDDPSSRMKREKISSDNQPERQFTPGLVQQLPNEWNPKLRKEHKEVDWQEFYFSLKYFQVKDSLNLEPEFTYTMTPMVYTKEEIREESFKKQVDIYAKGRSFPADSLKWKNIGIKIIRGKPMRFWQTAIVDPGAGSIKLYFDAVHLIEGSALLTYSVKDANSLELSNPYISWGPYDDYPEGNKPSLRTNTHDGDKVILELALPPDMPGPNDKSYLEIKTILHGFK